MATRLLKCSLCGEVVDAPVNGSSKPSCPTCGGELAPPTKARAAATATAGRPMSARRPLAAPRPVTPGEAISSSSASWIPDPDSRSRHVTSPPPSLPYDPPARAGKDWIRSPITYIVSGALVVILGVAIAFLLKGGSSSTASSGSPADAGASRSRPPLVFPSKGPGAADDSRQATGQAPTRENQPAVPAAPVISRPIDLLSLVDPVRDAVEGNWTRQPDGSLSAEATGKYNRICLPYQPPAEYDLTVTFTRTGNIGDDSVVTIFPDNRHNCTFVVNGWHKAMAAFNLVGHKIGPDNPTGVANHPISVGDRHTTVIKVRKDYIEGWLDGEKLSHYQTDGSDLSIRTEWQLEGNALGIGAISPTTFHSVELIEVNGHGMAGSLRK